MELLHDKIETYKKYFDVYYSLILEVINTFAFAILKLHFNYNIKIYNLIITFLLFFSRDIVMKGSQVPKRKTIS